MGERGNGETGEGGNGGAGIIPIQTIKIDYFITKVSSRIKNMNMNSNTIFKYFLLFFISNMCGSHSLKSLS